jgi:hypothetical protein
MSVHYVASYGSRPWRLLASLALLAPLLLLTDAQAKTFSWQLGDKSIDVTSNTTIIGGAAVRLESQDKDLIGKAHNDPNLCGRTNGVLHYQSCQGLFRTQSFPAERLVSGKGFAGLNFDQGNLNYDKGDLTQGLVKIAQDFNFTWDNYGLFIKGFYFHDFVNNDFDELRPNLITPENIDRVGSVSVPGTELVRAPAPVPAPVLVVRNDSRPCPPDRNPGIPGITPCGIVYGAGERLKTKRKDKETLDEIGSAFHLLDMNFYGVVDLPAERQLQFKVGRQAINWGESTVQFFDSLNVINPPNLNNLFRVGGNGLDDFFLPINAISLTTELFPGGILSAHYQLEWTPLVTPAPGGFYSPVNIGTNDAGNKVLTNGFGGGADDPNFLARLLDNPLSGLTNTTLGIERLDDREPGSSGQFGVEFKYYSEKINDGTEFGLYAMNYHSRTPIVSVISSDLSCAKSGAVPTTDGATFAANCPDIPILHAATQMNDPEGATDSAVAFDSLKVFLEYPEDVQMLGASFNTTVGGSGGISLQGEMAFRPNEPLQVAIVDLVFAGYGPTLTNCHLPGSGCLGSNTGVGVLPDGSVGTYGSSNFVVDADGTPGSFPDNFDAVVGHIPGSGRSFPSFVIPYRGTTIGTNAPNSYIRGWEEFDTFQFNLGATYVEGNTDWTPKLIGADQIIWLFEVAARWVPDIPDLDELQLEAPGLEYHASAGADGSGADRSRQACSTNEACSFGPDGLRFNPHQQDSDLFATEWSGGYSIVQLVRYESLFPGISLGIQNILKHDLKGHSPGLASNFIEDRILFDSGVELRYKSNLSFNVGYQVFTGGGVANAFKDRDNARAFIKYAF